MYILKTICITQFVREVGVCSVRAVYQWCCERIVCVWADVCLSAHIDEV